MRINKFISETGYCSRREADKLVEGEESPSTVRPLCWAVRQKPEIRC